MEQVLEYLADSLKEIILQELKNNQQNTYKMQNDTTITYKKEENDIEEIRIRVGKPIAIKKTRGIQIINYIVTTQEILETFQKVCENSIYSYKNQICEGFITIRGGHRVGITGSCVLDDGQADGKIINIKYISSLNFRIAREKINCAKNLLKYIVDVENKNIYNTLITSLPGAGKTTVLRDCIRQISNGISYMDFTGKTCGIVDERGEIASMYKGVPQNDVGILTDVIDNASKSKGMTMLIRSMAPQVIACDEIGSKEDIDAINYAMCTGVKGIFTAHGNSFEELKLNKQILDLLNKYILEKIIFLDESNRGKVKEVYELSKTEKKYIKVV